jgi:hypothetical protein
MVSKIGPIKSLGGLQDSIIKIRENFDLLVYGKLTQTGNDDSIHSDSQTDMDSDVCLPQRPSKNNYFSVATDGSQS